MRYYILSELFPGFGFLFKSEMTIFKLQYIIIFYEMYDFPIDMLCTIVYNTVRTKNLSEAGK